MRNICAVGYASSVSDDVGIDTCWLYCPQKDGETAYRFGGGIQCKWLIYCVDLMFNIVCLDSGEIWKREKVRKAVVQAGFNSSTALWYSPLAILRTLFPSTVCSQHISLIVSPHLNRVSYTYHLVCIRITIVSDSKPLGRPNLAHRFSFWGC